MAPGLWMKLRYPILFFSMLNGTYFAFQNREAFVFEGKEERIKKALADKEEFRSKISAMQEKKESNEKL